jgi:Raf kinase inhibitor-like YbhB/YbcL family protein
MKMVTFGRAAIWMLLLIISLSLIATSCGGNPGTATVCTVTLVVTSSGFMDGLAIPARYTAVGANISPPLAWNQLPPEVASLALLVEDMDSPGGAFTHWLVYNIPPTETSFGDGVPAAELLPNGARQGKNSFGTEGYRGPDPPSGALHHYRFRVFALDIKLAGQAGMTRTQLLNQIQGHLLAVGQLTGTFQK